MSKEKMRFHHVAIDSPEHLEMKQRKSGKQSSAFGESSLSFANFKLELAAKKKGSDLTTKEREDVLEENLGHQRTIFLRIIDANNCNDEMSQRRRDAANKFLKDAILDEELKKDLSESLGCSAEDLSLDKVACGLRDKQLPIDHFQKMLEIHVNEFHKKVEELEPIIEKHRKNFFESATTAISDGYLPIKEEVLSSRLAEQSSHVFDILDNVNLGEQEGSGVININADTPPESLRHIVYHESVHAIAGRSIATYRENGMDMTHEQKHGLRFILEHPDRHMIEGRFSWLDEAVTEEIALHLLGKREDEGVEGYAFERMFLKSVIEEGVPEELFRNAYFEDYNVDALLGERMPAWRTMAKKMSEVGRSKGIGLKDFSTMFK